MMLPNGQSMDDYLLGCWDSAPFQPGDWVPTSWWVDNLKVAGLSEEQISTDPRYSFGWSDFRRFTLRQKRGVILTRAQRANSQHPGGHYYTPDNNVAQGAANQVRVDILRALRDGRSQIEHANPGDSAEDVRRTMLLGAIDQSKRLLLKQEAFKKALRPAWAKEPDK